MRYRPCPWLENCVDVCEWCCSTTGWRCSSMLKAGRTTYLWTRGWVEGAREWRRRWRQRLQRDRTAPSPIGQWVPRQEWQERSLCGPCVVLEGSSFPSCGCLLPSSASGAPSLAVDWLRGGFVHRREAFLCRLHDTISLPVSEPCSLPAEVVALDTLISHISISVFASHEKTRRLSAKHSIKPSFTCHSHSDMTRIWPIVASSFIHPGT